MWWARSARIAFARWPFTTCDRGSAQSRDKAAAGKHVQATRNLLENGVTTAAPCAADKLLVHFQVEVLARYRCPGYSLLRTNSIGRVRKESGWSLDFGIAPGEATIHLSAGELMNLPAEDRDHWSGFVYAPPLSRAFLRTRTRPGSCVEDGDTRAWT